MASRNYVDTFAGPLYHPANTYVPQDPPRKYNFDSEFVSPFDALASNAKPVEKKPATAGEPSLPYAFPVSQPAPPLPPPHKSKFSFVSPFDALASDAKPVKKKPTPLTSSSPHEDSWTSASLVSPNDPKRGSVENLIEQLTRPYPSAPPPSPSHDPYKKKPAPATSSSPHEDPWTSASLASLNDDPKRESVEDGDFPPQHPSLVYLEIGRAHV